MAGNPSSTVTLMLPDHKGENDYLISGDCEALLSCSQKLNRAGIIAVMESENDILRLRLSGLKNVAQLKEIAGKNNLIVQQEPGIAGSQKDNNKNNKIDVWEWVKEHKLKVAGVAYLFGDASLFLSGIISKRYKEATTGLIYASGGGISAFYGDPSANRQIKNVGKELAGFMTNMGATIHKNTALSHFVSRNGKSPISAVNSYLYEHPSEVHNAIYAYGGTKFLQSGLEKRASSDAAKRSGWVADMAAGGLVTGGGMIGALVKEEHQENGEKPKGIIGWIKAKPLRLSGYLYTLNNAFLISSAWQEYKANPKQKSYIFKFFTAALFLVANGFLSVSSRHNSSSKEQMETKNNMIGGLAAEVIATQPDEMRLALIQQVAGFLSQRHETRQDRAVWEKVVADKVEALRSSRLIVDNVAAKEALSRDNQVIPGKNPGLTTWQEKVNSTTELPVTSHNL